MQPHSLAGDGDAHRLMGPGARFEGGDCCVAIRSRDYCASKPPQLEAARRDMPACVHTHMHVFFLISLCVAACTLRRHLWQDGRRPLSYRLPRYWPAWPVLALTVAVQALEAIRKLRTEKAGELKEKRAVLDHTRTHLDNAVSERAAAPNAAHASSCGAGL